MSTRIGCDNLVYAPLLTDTGAGPATWDDVITLPGVKSININPNASEDTLFLDDGPAETATSLGKIEVGIMRNDLTSAEKAALLGHVVDSKGGLVSSGNDTPPWVAIGFRTLKSNGMYRYVWLYKGKFLEPEDKNETKGDKVSFQEYEIKGSFVKLDTKYSVVTSGGTETGKQPWKYEIDEESALANPAVLATWFDDVKLPDDDTIISVTGVTLNKSTTSIVVAADETLVATVAPVDATLKTVVWSSSDVTKAIVNSAGKVTAVAAGEATITVTTVEGAKTDTCVVTVTAT